VGFRYSASGIASRLSVTGWVRNEADGSVLMEVQGDEKEVRSVLAEIQGAMGRNITNVEESTIPAAEGEHDFSIRR
jgi:acylphosphatase